MCVVVVEWMLAVLLSLGSVGDMVRIPGGAFFMGCASERDNACQDDEKPGRRVVLGTFWIDRSEVTVAQYRLCVLAGKCDRPGTGERCNFEREDADRHPVNCVDWSQARAFCRWAGKRLPTEAEWEKAARGTDGRTYPWGEQAPDCERVVMAGEASGCGRRATWPVCSRKAGLSPYGLCDMAGNVWEWVADWYDPDYYLQAPARNPPGPPACRQRVERGGSYYGTPRYLRAPNRDRDDPDRRDDSIGFRCAASPGAHKRSRDR